MNAPRGGGRLSGYNLVSQAENKGKDLKLAKEVGKFFLEGIQDAIANAR